MISARDALELGQILTKDVDRVDRSLEILDGIAKSKSAQLMSNREFMQLRNNLIYIKQDLNTAVRALPGEKPPRRTQF